jgi:hypothetical protein
LEVRVEAVLLAALVVLVLKLVECDVLCPIRRDEIEGLSDRFSNPSSVVSQK